MAGVKGAMGIEVWVEPGGKVDQRPRGQKEEGGMALGTTGRPCAGRGPITQLLDT